MKLCSSLQYCDGIVLCSKLQTPNPYPTIGYLEFSFCLCRIACPGEGLPPELVQDMFHSSRWVTQEGLGLSMCRKILKSMKGEVQYIRESERCYFLIVLDLPLLHKDQKTVD